MEEKAKPDLEYFFGYIYKGFCGKCGRIMFCGTVTKDKADIAKHVTHCQHCGTEVDWDD